MYSNFEKVNVRNHFICNTFYILEKNDLTYEIFTHFVFFFNVTHIFFILQIIEMNTNKGPKRSSITHAIKNIKNNCVLKFLFVKIIKFSRIYSSNMIMLLIILILTIYICKLLFVTCNIILYVLIYTRIKAIVA